jgi:hypothetical protein
VSATARDRRALPDRNAVSHLRRDLHGRADAMPRGAPASTKSSLVRAHPQNAFRPGMLEPQKGGRSSGAVFKRSFGVSHL